ncbi:helix-turn-helix domain-containing protein [Clostridium lacusfryxellense]|uniref:helix-turn-helix domain-containing protein n=1 Tax=Clostridium lacusfryxellense TaxID=205328 RepID=UPI001C0E3909|nr:helix-turn-helix domain-containing protein [Clostridium lacusfryxellense]MBU3113986.1 AraC family transcriptional regulator [Clostridium lacusfryxellense]
MTHYNSQDVDLNKMQKDIRFLLNSGNKEDIREYVDSILECSSGKTDKKCIENLCFSVIMCIVFVLNENNEVLNSCYKDVDLIWEKIFRFETIGDAREWIKKLVISANEKILSKSSSKYKLIVEEIKKFAKKNYMKGINIETISDNLNYTPNYLSYVFKKESGETIADYISNLKIEKAKEMLLDIRYKIYDISKSLAFSNAAYFCSVFKKVTSMTPNEYRERYR